jgi:D-glycero-D-manno-heptose 1,7-bisphosphate phosphatase
MMKATKAKPRRAVFFDRDGVVNGSPGEGSYVLSWWDFQFEPGVHDVLKWLKKQGFLLVLVTNQQCVGRGLITDDQLQAAFDAIYYSPHLKKENSPMRKPAPGMVLAAEAEHGIDLKSSWLVGDHDRDIELARNAGIGTAVRYVSEKALGIRADHTVKDHVELLALFKKHLAAKK